MTRQYQSILLRVVALTLAILCFLAWATADADTGFLTGEYTHGSKRYCIYDVMGDEVIITMDYADLCPLTVEV